MTSTLAVDVGGSTIKANVFDSSGVPLAAPIRVPTPYPCPPSRLIEELASLASLLPEAGRLGIGFPGLLRSARVVWVNSLVRRAAGGPTDPDLARLWVGCPLQDEVVKALGRPTLVANDADVAALASIRGTGLESVITLGTGFGFSLAQDGILLPHLELSEAPFRDGRDFEGVLGQEGLDRDGEHDWLAHVGEAVESLRRFLYFDHLFIGGGNARLLAGTDFGVDVSLVDNGNGLLGGYRLWADARAKPPAPN